MRGVLPHYSLGATDGEHRRLIALASHEEDRVIEACRRAGIGNGATVVDVGCGPVIGVDASAAALEKARAMLPQVECIHADVHEADIDGADLVYSRFMLLHQADPARTLQVSGAGRPKR